MPSELRRQTLPALLAVLFVFAIPPFCAQAHAQDAPAKDAPATPQDTTSNLHTATRVELDIIKVLLAQEAAWNRGDIDTFAQAYKNSPDTLFITRQVNRGYAGLVEEYKHDYPNKAAMGTLAFTDLEVHGLDEKYAVCIGKYQLDRSKKDGGHAEGLFSLVLEKTDKGWKIIVDHTTG
jgi:ketosteroid isomerase-like protein